MSESPTHGHPIDFFATLTLPDHYADRDFGYQEAAKRTKGGCRLHHAASFKFFGAIRVMMVTVAAHLLRLERFEAPSAASPSWWSESNSFFLLYCIFSVMILLNHSSLAALLLDPAVVHPFLLKNFLLNMTMGYIHCWNFSGITPLASCQTFRICNDSWSELDSDLENLTISYQTCTCYFLHLLPKCRHLSDITYFNYYCPGRHTTKFVTNFSAATKCPRQSSAKAVSDCDNQFLKASYPCQSLLQAM